MVSFSGDWVRGESVWGVGTVREDGVGILFTGGFVVESCVVPGRVLCVDGRWEGVGVRLINVWQGEAGFFFFEGLAPLLTTNRVVVLGGDFNVSLDTGTGRWGELKKVVEGYSLRDAGAAAKSGEGGWTSSNSRGAAARLDFF